MVEFAQVSERLQWLVQRAERFASIVVFALCFIVGWVIHADALVLREMAVSGVVLGAVIALAALFAAVLLAILGLLVTMQEMPLIAEIKTAGLYKQLVRFGSSCLYAFMVVAGMALAAVITAGVSGLLVASRTLVLLALSASAGAMTGTLQFTRVLIEILLFDGTSRAPRNRSQRRSGSAALVARSDPRPDSLKFEPLR